MSLRSGLSDIIIFFWSSEALSSAMEVEKEDETFEIERKRVKFSAKDVDFEAVCICIFFPYE